MDSNNLSLCNNAGGQPFGAPSWSWAATTCCVQFLFQHWNQVFGLPGSPTSQLVLNRTDYIGGELLVKTRCRKVLCSTPAPTLNKEDQLSWERYFHHASGLKMLMTDKRSQGEIGHALLDPDIEFLPNTRVNAIEVVEHCSILKTSLTRQGESGRGVYANESDIQSVRIR
jgi:hypothetical protein